MFVSAIGTALPQQRYTKEECWDAFTRSTWFERLGPRAHAVAKAVLRRDNGIEERWLAVDALNDVFSIDADTLHQRFVTHAPLLAAAAARQALERAQLDSTAIDAVIVTTCTGYLCPGLSGYVVESLGLRGNVLGFDLVGQGCTGALPNWQLASALLDSRQCEHVLSVCVEVCSAAMYLDDDPGVIISACLFGDGAGAAVLSRAPPADRRPIEWRHSVSLINPAEREALRFQSRGGLLRNVLTQPVPRLAAEHASQVLLEALTQAGIQQKDIGAWIFHAGGRDVLLALTERLGLRFDDMHYARDALRRYGNLSSAFVYFVLDAALSDAAPGGWWWMSSFGAGFTCHGALLAVD